MPRLLQIPGVAFKPNDARLLTDGSLLLIDPSHPDSPWAPGVPANGSGQPNIAAAEAAATVGAPVATATFAQTVAAGEGLVERTSKGGIHFIPSPSSEVLGHNVRLELITALRTFLNSNLSHDLYLSRWGRITRPADTSLTSLINDTAVRGTSGTRAGVGVIPSTSVLSGSPSSSDPRRLGFATDTTGGGLFEAIAADGSPSSGFTTPHSSILTRIGAGSSTELHKAAAMIIYRVYLEDLTVSGRSFAEVRAIDYERYTQEVLSLGGRYNGDTYTDPASIS